MEAMKKLGNLKIGSVSRNIFQSLCSSPLKVLRELYDYLVDYCKEPPKYKGKELFEIGSKTLKDILRIR